MAHRTEGRTAETLWGLGFRGSTLQSLEFGADAGAVVLILPMSIEISARAPHGLRGDVGMGIKADSPDTSPILNKLKPTIALYSGLKQYNGI